jgi:hypothetical protein
VFGVKERKTMPCPSTDRTVDLYGCGYFFVSGWGRPVRVFFTHFFVEAMDLQDTVRGLRQFARVQDRLFLRLKGHGRVRIVGSLDTPGEKAFLINNFDNRSFHSRFLSFGVRLPGL